MIHLYNPSTDLALANGKKTYTPPKNVYLFERKNILLPSLYARETDAVLVPYDDLLNSLNELPFYNEGIRYLTLSELIERNDAIMPWGWNPALRQMLLRKGWSPDKMPSEDILNNWRDLAHRRSTIIVNELIGMEKDRLPREYSSLEEAVGFVKRHSRAMLKLPWSSSGRGVLPVCVDNLSAARKRIEDAIRSQGSIMIETLANKMLDFATEWESDGMIVRFKGFSLFRTDNQGRYVGNVIASQAELLNRMTNYTSLNALLSLPERLRPALEYLLVSNTKHPYEGPFGVDALIDNNREIWPCIEINLRRTMGHVALDVAKDASYKGKLLHTY